MSVLGDEERRAFRGGAGQVTRRRDEMVVTLTQEDHPALASSLANHIRKQRADHVERLATHPAKDFSEYMKRVGVTEGLAIAIAAAEERNKALHA